MSEAPTGPHTHRAAISPGTRAARWEMVRPLGEGGGGWVWLGVDPQTGDQAALKFFPTLRTSREEFRKEAAVALRNRHPSLLRLLDAGLLADDTPWLAMEFVEGEDLRARFTHTPPTPQEAARLLIQVFAALDALHRAGLAHGDIKPENVLVDGGLVRVVDFGRAQLHHMYSQGGVFPGTPPYMHPAMFHGGAPTPLTDCFAAWVMLHESASGTRPFTPAQLASAGATHPPQRLPRRALTDPVLDRLIEAGLSGRLPNARAGWLALTRYLRNREDVPRPSPPPIEPDPDLLERALGYATRGTNVALVGDHAVGSRILTALHRSWALDGGTVLWARADWGSAEEPMSGALSLASHAADGIPDEELSGVAEAMASHGRVLAEASPSTRTWLSAAAPAPLPSQPPSGTLSAALRAFCDACPRPLLLIAEGVDRMDGSSRRFLAGLSLTDVVVVGTAREGAPHGLSEELALPEVALEPVDLDWMDRTGAELLRRADVLGLPYGPRLATAAGLTVDVVEDCALEAEAVGAARWTGVELLPRSPGPTDPAEAQRFAREAARRLDARTEPLIVARYARMAGDTDRLATVLDAAVTEALRRDPVVALDLLRAAHDYGATARLLQTFHVAVQARNMEVAADLVARMKREPTFSKADRAEAEGEFAFRTGKITEALSAYREVVSALGRPIHNGVRGFLQDFVAIWRLWRDKPKHPSPNPRLALAFERLYDMHFNTDNAPMLRIHALWREADPHAPRVRAMDVVWNVALGRKERAMRVHNVLWSEVAEHNDPTGAAVILLHRAIARSWTGEITTSYIDALDAAERLLRVGDPYLASLAVGTVAVGSFHLGDPGPLRRINRRLAELVQHTGDIRCAGWVIGHDAVVRLLEGNHTLAIEAARAWVADAEPRQDCTVVLARRVLAEMLLDQRAYAEAGPILLRAWAERAHFHMQMDYTDALAIDLLIAHSQAKLAGAPGLPRPWRFRQVMTVLGRKSPRWRARSSVATGWLALAAGNRKKAEAAFENAHTLALNGEMYADAWWALHHAALALGGDDRVERAQLYARAHGLRPEAPAPTFGVPQ